MRLALFNLAAAALAAFFFSASAFFAASIWAMVGALGGFASAGVNVNINMVERQSARTRARLDLNSWLPGECGGQLLMKRIKGHFTNLADKSLGVA